MGSALETLCGQAYGAGQIRMLGVYMQRSWVILLTTAALLVPVYVWSSSILELLGVTKEISEASGQYCSCPYIFFFLNFFVSLTMALKGGIQAKYKIFLVFDILVTTSNPLTLM